jgi:hypothetical protein
MPLGLFIDERSAKLLADLMKDSVLGKYISRIITDWKASLKNKN